ncbi:MAG: sugar transferase, partial [Burkholderiales bacterium]
MLKRVMDIAGALLGIALLLPLWALIALAIKLDSRGPALFRLRVAGKDGRPFDELKFRTMVHGAMAMGLGRETAAADPRITRVGRLLRRTSLDETPQLWNVLR